MSILFPDGLPTTDRFGNEIYTDYRNMIRLEGIYDDDDLTDVEKVIHSLGLLYGEIPEGLSLEDAVGELRWFYTRGESGEESGQGSNKKLYDFDEDGDCIFTAFLTAYGIDLTKEENLHWWKFVALMGNIPKETLLAEKIYYRGLDTSKFKGQQKKEAEKYKRIYALKKQKQTVKKRLKSLKQRLEERQAEINGGQL